MAIPAVQGRARAPLVGALLSLILLLAVASPPGSHSSHADDALSPALEEAFQADELQRFIVLLEDQPEQPETVATTDEARKARYATQTAFVSEHQRSVRAVVGREVRRGRAFDPTYLWIVNAIVVTGTKDLAQTLANRSDVAAVLPNEQARVAGFAPAPAAAPEWNLERVKATEAWADGVTGAGAVVGSIDTGVQWDHPALIRQYRGWNGTTANHNYNWADFESDVPAQAPFDDYAHGTHVTGIMVGDDGGSNHVGVAPNAKWIAAKACDADGVCFSDRILMAMQWMQAPTDLAGANPDPTKAPDVVVASLGDTCENEIYRAALQSWRAAGILGVFSGGNTSFVPKPACYPEAVAVGATDANDNVPSWSGHGPSTYGEIKPDLVAPGVSIRSTIPGNGYQFLSGTSMSAPHVAGVAALLASLSGAVTDDVIEALLAAGAADMGPAGPDNAYGAGLVDAAGALRILTEDGVKPSIDSFTLRSPATGSETATNDPRVEVELTATDDVVIAGYLLTASSTTPSPSDDGWSEVRPTTYTLTGGSEVKTVYAWAMDLAGNVSSAAKATIALDTVAPTASVAIATLTRSVNVPLKVTATDNVGVAGFILSTSATQPGPADARWQSRPPSSIRLGSGDGVKRVFGWTRDAAGNVSAAAVSTTVLDTLAPSLSFSTVRTATSTTIPVAISVSDASGVVGYYMSEDGRQPSSRSGAWSTVRPTSFALSNREGRHNVFAWVLDRTGNVSRRSSATVVLDTRAPRPAVQTPRPGARVTVVRTLRGLTGDPAPSSGVASVQWALVRTGDCAWYSTATRRMMPGTCGSPVWNTATVAGRRWLASLASLRDAGTYTIYVVATDRAGNALLTGSIPGTTSTFTILPSRTRRGR